MLRDQVLVDTSVWIEYERGGNASICAKMRSLLKNSQVQVCALVFLELLRGITRAEHPIKGLLTQLPRLDMDWAVYEKAADISLSLRPKGISLTLSDSLIAATALQADVPLFTIDKDFKNIPGLTLF